MDCLEKADGTVVGNREQLHGLQKLQIEHFMYAIDVEAPRGARILMFCVWLENAASHRREKW